MVDQCIDGMPRISASRWRRQHHAAKPVIAVDMFRRDQRAGHWRIASGEDWNQWAVREFADNASIARCQVQRDIAGHAGDAQNVELRRGEGEENCDGVILAGIRVDDDLVCHGRGLGGIAGGFNVGKRGALPPS